MKLLKNLFIGALLGIGLITSSLQAAGTITNFTLTAGAKTNLLSTNAWNIVSLKVTTGTLPTGTNAVVKFFDNNTAGPLGINYTNAAYTNYTRYKTNITEVITNSFGNLQTNVYPGIYTERSTTVANTNTLPTLAIFTVGDSTEETQTANIVTVKGLVAQTTTDVTNVTVEVEYYSSP